MQASDLQRGKPTARTERLAKVVCLLAMAAAILVWPLAQLYVVLHAPALPGEPLTAAEAAAFRAGREVAYEELSGAVALAYTQGRQDALACAASPDGRAAP